MANKTVSNTANLIVFDKPTKIVVYVCLILFVIGVAFKFHYSHIPVWYEIFGQSNKAKKEVVMGKANTIRSDEWLVDATHLLNQYERDFPVINESLGYGHAPLLMFMPVKNYTLFFRPQFYGFFFLDIERAFSFLWLYRVFVYFIGVFLFCKLLFNNNFGISIFTTIWIYLSSGVQWWSISSHVVSELAFCVLFLIYGLYTNNKRLIPVFTFISSIFAYSFLSSFYPPRQIPIVFLFLILFVSYITKNYGEHLKKDLIFKLVNVILSYTLLLVLVFLTVREASDTIDALGSTVYPGKRSSNGGTWGLDRFFSEFLFYFIKPDKLPATWGNICEASGFLLFFPVLIAYTIYSLSQKKRDSILILMSALLLVEFVFMVWGLPEFIAKISLLSMAPPFRLTYGFGISSIFFTSYYLSHKEYKFPSDIKNKIIVVASSFISLLFILNHTNDSASNFFTSKQITISAIYFSLIFYFLFFKELKYHSIIAMILISLYIAPNILANPLSRGLKPITDSNLYKAIKNLKDVDRDAKWVLLGNQFVLSNFIKSTGVNVFTGVKYAPDIKTMRKIDISGKNDSIYNRYAHIVVNSMPNPMDSVIFQLPQQDLYIINIDPCSNKLRNAGVKYFVFSYNPKPEEVRCMDMVFSASSISIYKIRETK